MRKHDEHKPLDPLGDQLARTLGAVENLNDTMTQLTTGMKTRDASRLLGAEARAFTLTATGGAGTAGVAQVAGPSSGVLLGLNVRETAGTATVVRVLDGLDQNAGVLLTFVVAANADRTILMPAPGVSFTTGVFLHCVGGVIEGAVYLSAGRLR